MGSQQKKKIWPLDKSTKSSSKVTEHTAQMKMRRCKWWQELMMLISESFYFLSEIK